MSFRYRLPEGRPVGSMVYAPSRPLSGTVGDIVGSEAVTTGAAVACVYHGYKRTGSLIWALIWGIAGKKLPVVAVPVALAQGFAKRKGCDLVSNPGRRRKRRRPRRRQGRTTLHLYARANDKAQAEQYAQEARDEGKRGVRVVAARSGGVNVWRVYHK